MQKRNRICNGGINLIGARFNTDTFQGRDAVRKVKAAIMPLWNFKQRMIGDPVFRHRINGVKV